MAFGSRHCCALALLLLVITQVMLSTAYQDEHTYSSRSRSGDYDRHDPMDRHDRNGHDRNGHDSKENHDGHDSGGDDHDESAATSVKAMFQTTMLVGTSLMLYWI